MVHLTSRLLNLAFVGGGCLFPFGRGPETNAKFDKAKVYTKPQTHGEPVLMPFVAMATTNLSDRPSWLVGQLWRDSNSKPLHGMELWAWTAITRWRDHRTDNRARGLHRTHKFSLIISFHCISLLADSFTINKSNYRYAKYILANVLSKGSILIFSPFRSLFFFSI